MFGWPLIWYLAAVYQEELLFSVLFWKKKASVYHRGNFEENKDSYDVGLLARQRVSCSTSGYLAAYCVSLIIQTPMTVAKLVTSGFGHTGSLSYVIVHHALPIMV